MNGPLVLEIDMYEREGQVPPHQGKSVIKEMLVGKMIISC